MPEKIGLQAVFETTQFQSGLNTYLNGLSQAGASTSKTASGIVSATQMLGAGIAVALGEAVLGAVAKVSSALVNMGSDVLMAAGRFNELMLVAQLLGQKAGYTADQIEQTVTGIRKQGIEAGVAADLVAQFARYNLDLASATKLAAVAQDAAVISGTDSTEALARLLLGITTQQTETLRTAGILVDLSQANEKFAGSNKTSADSMTGAQKVAAALNAVLAEGAKIQGAYAIAMTNPVKLLGSMPRLFNDIAVSVGTPFQDAFGTSVFSLYNLVKAFSGAVSEGGALYPVLQNLGAVASVIADQFSGLVGATQGPLINWIGNLATSMGNAATDAFTWGMNIITQLATGIIEGASSVLIGAMDFIGSILSMWLSPGSPPKIAPYIDKWGAATITEWFKGFGSADFSVLKSIQGPLQNALSLLVEQGRLDKGAAGGMFVGLTEGITAAIQAVMAGGKAPEDIFQKLAEATGQFGTAIVALTRDQLDLAAATYQAGLAEKALADAQKKESDTNAKAAALRREYNAMLRAGASPEALRMKLAEIQAAERAADASTVERRAAEANVETTKAGVDAMQERVKAQEALVAQLLELAKLQIPEAAGAAEGAATKPKAAGGGGGKGAGVPKLPEAIKAGTLALSDMQKKAADAFASIKAKAADAFKDVFNPLLLAWNTKIAPLLMDIEMAWVRLRNKILEIWWQFAPSIEPVRLALEQLFGPVFVENLGKVVGALLPVAVAIGVVTVAVGAITAALASPVVAIGLLVMAIVALYTAWQTNWQGTKDILNMMGTLISYSIQFWVMLLNTFITNIRLGFQQFGEIIDRGVKGWIGAWNLLWTMITGIAANIMNSIMTWASNLIIQIGTTWATIQTAAVIAWESLKASVISAATGLVSGLYDVGKNIVQGLIDGIRSRIQAVVDAAREVISSIPEAIRKLLRMESPSKVMMELGVNATQGFTEGMMAGLPKMLSATRAVAQAAISGARYQALTPAAYNSRTYNMNLGGNTINNGMDMATFEARVKKIVTEMI